MTHAAPTPSTGRDGFLITRRALGERNELEAYASGNPDNPLEAGEFGDEIRSVPLVEAPRTPPVDVG